jgi:hypothetical protein
MVVEFFNAVPAAVANFSDDMKAVVDSLVVATDVNRPTTTGGHLACRLESDKAFFDHKASFLDQNALSIPAAKLLPRFGGFDCFEFDDPLSKIET